MNRMKKKLKETKVEVKLSKTMLAVMEKQLKEIQENPIQLRDTITAALKEMLKEEAVGDIDSEELMSDNDTAELVDFVIQSLKNHSIKKVGKNNFSFSPYLMGLTMKNISKGLRHTNVSERTPCLCVLARATYQKRNTNKI